MGVGLGDGCCVCHVFLWLVGFEEWFRGDRYCIFLCNDWYP
ncbi:hypothetical protein [Okeania sp. SIO2B3]|nr:hypothetical protein [Okeania sp. SIO2B3]